MEILIGTQNIGKIKEIERLLQNSRFVLRSLRDFSNIVDVEESGKTFAENASLKAVEYSRKTRLWTLADDSGLEIEALNGQPGVFSARYAGENASNEAKITKVLTELKDAGNRKARFVCVMAIADINGEIKYLAEGICQGTIDFRAKGENGFGYDPIFIPQGFSQTFGELSEEIKQKISHRSQAISKIVEYLNKLT